MLTVNPRMKALWTLKALSHESVSESDSVWVLEALWVITYKGGIAARPSLLCWLQVSEGATHQREEILRYILQPIRDVASPDNVKSIIFSGEHLGSFFAGPEDWTEKQVVFLRSELKAVVYLRLSHGGVYQSVI